MVSFFEKLTGASEDETKKTPQKNNAKKIAPKIKQKKPSESILEKDIKTEEKIMKKTNIEKPILNDKIEEKNWLEEAEGEEGQLTLDVYQTDSDIVIKSTIAGVNPEDIDINITNDMVTIRGKRVKDDEVSTENYYYQELYWGSFSRSVILPVEVDTDRAKANIKNGILTLKLPKVEKVKTKKIKVDIA